MQIGGVELGWQHPDIKKIDTSSVPAFGGYDALLINVDGLFKAIADKMLAGNVWSDQWDTVVTRSDLANQLSAILQQMRTQLRELCSFGGLVVGFVEHSYSVCYDIADRYYQTLYQAMGKRPSRAHVISLDLLFGPFYVPGGRDWEYRCTGARGQSVALVEHSIWDRYLNADVEFRLIIEQVPRNSNYRPIGAQKIIGRTSDDIIAVAEEIGSGQMALLPLPSSQAAQETLLDCIKEALAGPLIPEWATSFPLPGTDSLKQQIEQAHAQIDKATKGIEDLERWRKLLYEKHDALDTMVGRALKLIGFACHKPDTTDDADWVITDLGKKIAVEVGGSKDPIGKSKVTQAAGWIDREDTGYNRGLLIVNPYCLTDPRARESWPLERQISKEGLKIAADRGDLGIMLTTELFALVELCLQGRLFEAKAQFHTMLGKSLRVGQDGHWERY